MDGTLEGVEGDADPVLTGIQTLDRAGPHDLAFLAEARYLTYLPSVELGALLVAESLASRVPAGIPRICVRDVRSALATLLPVFFPEPPPESGIHHTAVIGEGAQLGADVYIGPYAVIGESVRLGDRARVGAHSLIGNNCLVGSEACVHPGVTLYPGVRVGARTVLHSGCRIGVDGFGYVAESVGHRKIPHIGGVVLGENVELGANVTVDRGSIGDTVIGDGVKVDNLVQIGHNVRIGDHSIIVAQVGISGSTMVGRRVTIGGQAGLAGHITIGDGAVIAAQAGVIGDVPAGAVYSGYPARPHREAMRGQAFIKKVPRVVERVKKLEQAIFGGKDRGE